MRRPQALSLSSDLLTGTEWNAAHVRELFRLATDVKAHPDRYKSALAGPLSGDDF